MPANYNYDPTSYTPYDPIAAAPQYDWRGGITGNADVINSMGDDSLAAARASAARRVAQQQADQDTALANAGLNARNANQQAMQNAGVSVDPSSGKVSGTGGFAQFMKAISQQESGGNYGAINKTSGAMGKYQIMPSNILGTHTGWDWQVLGRDINEAEFLNSPQIQEQIATAKLQGYYNKYGPAGAAVAWYAGPGAAQKYVSSGKASTGKQGVYPSVSGYMKSILHRMGYA